MHPATQTLPGGGNPSQPSSRKICSAPPSSLQVRPASLAQITASLGRAEPAGLRQRSAILAIKDSPELLTHLPAPRTLLRDGPGPSHASSISREVSASLPARFPLAAALSPRSYRAAEADGPPAPNAAEEVPPRPGRLLRAGGWSCSPNPQLWTHPSHPIHDPCSQPDQNPYGRYVFYLSASPSKLRLDLSPLLGFRPQAGALRMARISPHIPSTPRQ